MLINGSQGEGGGQIVRTSLALATLLQKPIEIRNIRAKRKKPGLRPQHLMAVQALAEISDAETQGAFQNSTTLTFRPRTINGGSYRFTIGTAGSTTLLLAAILPPLLFAPLPSKIVIDGGTHVPFSPPFHYLEKVFFPSLRFMGAQVNSSLNRWGWYPKGGGKISVHIQPAKELTAVQWSSRGRLKTLEILIGLSNLPDHIAEREQAHVQKKLAESGHETKSQIVLPPAAGAGNIVFLRNVFEKTIAGFSGLGRKGKPAEQVAEEVWREWFNFNNSRATVDCHLADQLSLYLALAKGKSVFFTEKLTNHLTTNIKIIEQFLPVHFELDHVAGKVSIEGVHHTSSINGAKHDADP